MTRVRTFVLASTFVSAVGAAGVVATALHDVRRALLGWAAAVGWGVSMATAALVLAMVLHVTRARWWLAMRPILMSLAGTLPVFVLAFIPIALGLHHLYPWALPRAAETLDLSEQVAHALEHQRAWNSPAFFLARAAFYFVVWFVLYALLVRADRIYLRAPTSELPERFQAQRRVSAAGLPIMALTINFAAFDWLMSIEPAWYSTAFGLYVFTAGLVTAIALLAIGVRLARDAGLLSGEVNPSQVHAVGRLLLMAVILWGYIGFFQLVFIWIADMPHESSFFGARAKGPFVAVDWVLVVGHFVIPFLVLLSRPLKRAAGPLALVAGWLAVASAVDFAWLVLPQADGTLRVLDVAPFLVVAGAAGAYAAYRTAATSRPSEDVHVDPVLRESFSYRSP